MAALTTASQSAMHTPSTHATNVQGSRAERLMAEETALMCVWNMGFFTRKALWALLHNKMSEYRFNQLFSIVRVVQVRDGHVRFDIEAQKTFFSMVMNAVRAVLIPKGAHIRAHIPHHIRRQSLATADASNLSFLPKVVTLNINSMQGKVDEIVGMISDVNADIVLLQETMRVPEDLCHKLWIKGYLIHETPSRPAVEQRGARGLAFIYRSSLPFSILKSACNDFCLAAEMRMNGVVFRVYNLYVPSRPEDNIKDAIVGVLQNAAHLASRGGSIDLIAGDFNKSRSKLTTSYLADIPSLTVLEASNPEQPTFNHRNGVNSSHIDHFIVSGAAEHFFEKPLVLEQFDSISDHVPVSIACCTPFLALPQARPRIARLNKRKLAEKKEEIRNAGNYWAPLAQFIDEEEMTPANTNTATAQFLEAFTLAAEDFGVQQPVAKANNNKQLAHHPLTKATRIRMQTYRSAHAAVKKDTTPEEVRVKLARRLPKLKRRAEEAVAKDHTQSFRAFVNKGVESMKGDGKNLFKFLRTAAKYNTSKRGLASSNTPIVDSISGDLASAPETIMAAFTNHYQALLTIPAELSSQEFDFWHTRLAMSAQEELPNMDAEFTWPEVCAHVAIMPGYKAPGPSGMEVAWIKIACDPKSKATNNYPANPTTDMGYALLRICNSIFTTHSVPEALRAAFIVSIHKSGDKTCPANYRGISLIDSILKVVTGILTQRLQTIIKNLPPNRGLSVMQAGFRPTEECIGQVAALLEICQRRRVCGGDTYLAFLDLQKAFDRVPHGAMLYKLEQFGVRGHTLEFFRALYNSSVGIVRDHVYGIHGEAFPVTRGVRQGCPSSPLMFNIFINDFLTNVSMVRIPFQIDASDSVSWMRTAGLLFADDSVVLAESAEQLEANLEALAEWGMRNGMDFNASKSGLMLVCGEAEGAQDKADYLQRLAEEGHFSALGGVSIPIVGEYLYLGITFNDKLDVKRMCEARGEKIIKAMNAIHGFIAGRHWPMCAKFALIRSVARSLTTYGGEIFGLSESNVARLSSMFNKVVARMTMSWGRPAAAIIRRELGLFSVHATASAQRVRAFYKYADARSIIHGLVQNPFPKAAWAWTTGTGKLLQTKKIAIPEEMKQPWEVSKYVREQITAIEDVKVNKGVGAQWYVSNAFERTKAYTRAFVSMRNTTEALDMGFAGLMAARAKAMWLGRRAASAGLIDAKYKTVCPCCEEDSEETMSHLFLECPRWAEQREEYLAPVLAKISRMREDMTAAQTLAVLLGGVARVATHTTVSLGTAFYCGTNPVYVAVAGFLGAIKRMRDGLLWSSSTSLMAAGEGGE